MTDKTALSKEKRGKRPKSKLIIEHARDCYAMKNVRNGVWSTPWAYVQPDGDYRDSLGRRRRNGGRRWVRIGCNSHVCPALIAVEESSLLEMLPNG